MKDRLTIVECEQGTGMSLYALYLAITTAKLHNKVLITNFSLPDRYIYFDFESLKNADTLHKIIKTAKRRKTPQEAAICRKQPTNA